MLWMCVLTWRMKLRVADASDDPVMIATASSRSSRRTVSELTVLNWAKLPAGVGMRLILVLVPGRMYRVNCSPVHAPLCTGMVTCAGVSPSV